MIPRVRPGRHPLPQVGQELRPARVVERPLPLQPVVQRHQIDRGAVRHQPLDRPEHLLVGVEVEVVGPDHPPHVVEDVRVAEDAAEQVVLGPAVVRRQAVHE